MASDLAIRDRARQLVNQRSNGMERLEMIYRYLRDDPEDRRLGGIPAGAPADVIRLARISRVNLLKFVVNTRVQSMYVDGFQTPDSAENVAAWEIWQRNGLDARQIGIHRAALAYGASYTTVLPGTSVPVIRGYSPRQLTAWYADEGDDFPVEAIVKRRGGWRYIDDTHVVDFTVGAGNTWTKVRTAEHGARYEGEKVCPVVRYRDTIDLDDPVRGIVEPFIPLQDQVNITSFGLQVAQHYGAFRQRYIIGWLAASEQAALKMGASRLMTFEDDPEQIKVGEFGQTELRGYIESREASIRHLATVSQTPVHELLGQMINLSAEALEAARASHHAAGEENRTTMGESHELTLNLAAEMHGGTPNPEAAVVWRDTRIRSLREAAEGLGALAEKLGVPPRGLWHLIPNVPRHVLKRWEEMAERPSDIEEMTKLFERQANSTAPAAPPAPAPEVPVGANG